MLYKASALQDFVKDRVFGWILSTCGLVSAYHVRRLHEIRLVGQLACFVQTASNFCFAYGFVGDDSCCYYWCIAVCRWQTRSRNSQLNTTPWYRIMPMPLQTRVSSWSCGLTSNSRTEIIIRVSFKRRGAKSAQTPQKLNLKVGLLICSCKQQTFTNSYDQYSKITHRQCCRYIYTYIFRNATMKQWNDISQRHWLIM